MIDAVLGAAPERLDTLLRALWSSNERLEARVVVELAWRCRDPLAPLSSLCRDALKAAADLDTLLRLPEWRKLEEVCRFGHANAILNLCDVTLSRANPNTAERRKRLREIRPRVKVAAVAEMNSQHERIERLRNARRAALPSLWEFLETYVSRSWSRRGSPETTSPNQAPLSIL